MITQVLSKIFGTQHEREMKRLQPLVDAVNGFESTLKAKSDAQLQAMTGEFKQRFANGATLDDILAEAFAVCREGAKRALGMRHYDVQLIGGMILHRGAIAEMKTGEGKTLVATLPIYLNALSGKGVHLVTVNDYLAKRDAEWMGRLYSWLQMSTGVIVHGQNDREKQAAYRCDIAYATNNELGFDYLRDNMKFDLADYSQRDLNYAIVDECDSILVDEARTPLIISGPAEDSVEKYYFINSIIPHLKNELHFTMEEKSRTASLTEDGNHKVEELLKIGNLYDPEHIDLLHHVYQGIKAHHLYRLDVDYMIKGDEVIIVDEFTGRLMEGRRWSDGLHQAVEAKEGVKVKNENQTLATITFQNYFRMYKKLAGMTGTADTEAVEFKKIYKLDVSVIPTHRPIARKDEQDVVYKTGQGKFNAILSDVKERQEKGQPVLVGTVSIEKSELLSQHLKKANVPHTVLNAKHHEREAEIVAQAGRKGAVTIATNMAGRGTDIVLGGNPEGMAKMRGLESDSEEYAQAIAKFKTECEQEKKDVIAAGGLYIVGTERHESRRIDNQLRGRSGRQGDPGETRFFLSLDDDLMRKFNGERIQKIMTALDVPEDEPIMAPMVTRSIESAQRKVEGHNFDIRKHLLDYDDVMNQQRTAIYGLRREILLGEKIDEIVREMLGDVTSHVLDTFAHERQRKELWNLDGLKTAMGQAFGAVLDIPPIGSLDAGKLTELVKRAVMSSFERQRAQVGAYFPQVQKMILLQTIDQRWKEHLARIDQLRDWINLAAYAQKDPLIEYKQEAFKAFEEMNYLVKAESVEKIIKIQLVLQNPDDLESEFERGAAQLAAQLAADAAAPIPSEPLAPPPQDAAEQLEALRPKQRQRLVYTGPGDDDATGGGGSQMSRSDRRRLERENKKKRM